MVRSQEAMRHPKCLLHQRCKQKQKVGSQQNSCHFKPQIPKKNKNCYLSKVMRNVMSQMSGAVVPIGRLWRHSKWLSNPGRRDLGLLLKLRMYLNRVKTNIFLEWFLKHVEIKHSVNFWNSFYKRLAENSHLCFKMAWIYDAKKILNPLFNFFVKSCSRK